MGRAGPWEVGIARDEPAGVEGAGIEGAGVEPARVEPAGVEGAGVEGAGASAAGAARQEPPATGSDEQADFTTSTGQRGDETRTPETHSEVGSKSLVAPPVADLDVLEEERDFCLRSLRDLEAEYEAGDIDEIDYQSLKDVYTVRAASALRALDGRPALVGSSEGADDDVRAGGEGGSTRLAPTPGARRGLRRGLIAVAVVAAAGGAAWAVVASSATRLPGQEITGQALGAETIAKSLQQAQQAADRGDDLTAVKDYQKILDSDPDQAEALTGEGWLLAQTQQPALLRQGLTMLLDAERGDPTYAPAHVYRGISLLSEGDYADAIPELKWYLAHSPDPTLAPRVRAALLQAQKQVVATKG